MSHATRKMLRMLEKAQGPWFSDDLPACILDSARLLIDERDDPILMISVADVAEYIRLKPACFET